MNHLSRAGGVVVLLSGLLFSNGAGAASTDAQKCEADKLKRAGIHSLCQLKAQSKFVKGGDAARLAADLAKCDDKIEIKFDKADERWGSECPTTGDVAAVQAQVTEDTEELGLLLSGAPPSPVCGNMTIEAGEECEFGDLGGETCDSLTAGAQPIGTLACTPGACTFDTSGCALRFQDTGLTIIDHQTGLEWEKKTGTLGVPSPCPGGANCGDLNDVNNQFSWANGGQNFDGSAKTVFLDGLNDVAGGGANCFAGHCNWRIPSTAQPDQYGVFDLGELDSITDCSGGAPCVDPAMGANASDRYWSSTASWSGPWATWTTDFLDGSTAIRGKSDFYHVRAVRRVQ